MDIPVDIYESIIIHADIDDISSICLTNSIIHKLCHNKHVWIKKFESEQLPIVTMQSNIKGWINEYKRIKYAKFYSEHVLILIIKESEKFDKEIEFFIGFKTGIVDLLPESLQLKLLKYDIKINKNDLKFISIESVDNQFLIEYIIADQNNNKKIHENDYIDKKTLQHFLFNLLYYFPDIDIEDEREKSYLKIYHINNNSQYMKMIAYRNEFWNNLDINF